MAEVKDQEVPAGVSSGRPAEPDYPSESYAWYVVGVLMIVYVFSFIDRQIFSFLVEPIKADLNISDTQVSYLMGFSFALFYTFFGIPMGRLADARSRRGIIAIGLTAWSLMSAGCGIARNYAQLLLFRVGVGVGEATLSPSAYSLLTDYFRPQRLALAISVYGAGIYIGSGLAFLVGGQVAEYARGVGSVVIPLINMEVRPWQLVFFIIGLPGVLFALLLMTVKEPLRRGVLKARTDGTGRGVPLAEVAAYVRDNWKTFLSHNVGFGLLAMVAYGSAAWIPEFYRRTHGWGIGETGLRYGVAVMIFGSAGIIFGGVLADKLAAKGYKDARVRVGFIAAVAHLPLGLLFPIVDNAWLSFLILIPVIFTIAMPFGVAPAAIQEMMPNQMRGQASAIYLFIVNLIGLGVGPTAVALFTDYVFGDELMLRYSLLSVSAIGGVLSIVLLWWGMNQFRLSLQYLNRWNESNSATTGA